jgi:hypothetical protein
LKLWFVLRTYGIHGLQRHIRQVICLGHFEFHFYSLFWNTLLLDISMKLLTYSFCLTLV